MIRIAALHETMAGVMQHASAARMERPGLVHGTAHAPEFLGGLANRRVDGVLLSLETLGDDPVRALDRVLTRVAPRLALVVYSFTRSATLGELRARTNVQVVRAPVTLEGLRTQLLEPAADRATPADESPQRGPRPSVARLIETAAPARHCTELAVANLQQVRSRVACECPHQVADVLIALNGFEEYSRRCGNKDDEDARVHVMLYRATGQARAITIMEEAMKRLCRHEGIEVDRHGNTRMDLMQMSRGTPAR